MKFQTCLIGNNCKPPKQCSACRREEEDESQNDRCRCLFWLCDACEKKKGDNSEANLQWNTLSGGGPVPLLKISHAGGTEEVQTRLLKDFPSFSPRREFQFAPRVRSCPACPRPATSLLGGRRTQIGSDCLELFRDGSRRYDTICQSAWCGDKRFAESRGVCSQASKLLWGFFFYFSNSKLVYRTLVENMELLVSRVTPAILQPLT